MRLWPKQDVSPDESKLGRIEWKYVKRGPPDHTVSIEMLGQPGRRHCITAILASYNQRNIGLLTVLEGTCEIAAYYCHTERDLNWTHPLMLEPGATLQVTLSKGTRAPGELVCCLTVIGYSEDAEEA